MSFIPVLSPQQAAEWDHRAVAAGIAEASLMECAGRAVAGIISDRFGAMLGAGRGVLVACGSGNNGGDGWVVARALHRTGAPVSVTAADPDSGSPLCRQMAQLARNDGVREVSPDGPWPAVSLVVDAMLGGGARGAPRDALAKLSARIVDLDLPVVAVDGPTGLDLLTGVHHGPSCIHASLTVTFGGYRRGHLLARDEVGDVVVVDIGFPQPDPAWPRLFSDLDAFGTLPPLAANAHKGTRGRVVIVGGDTGLTGAARLSARAAFGAGAGLVHILAPDDSVKTLATAEPDIQTRIQRFDRAPEGDTRALLEQADAVVIGPGLNRDPSRTRFVLDILEISRVAVVDADALTALQGNLEGLSTLAASRTFVLTPHAGEFRTLFPGLAAEAGVDPWEAARAAADQSGATVLLKGVPTVVAGRGASLLTVAAGNPGLATGGSGDTLSGLIATFLAQGVAAQDAAALGAHVLGRAADLAARRHGARGLRPMEVVQALPELWRGWELAALRRDHSRSPILHELEAPPRV